MKFSNFVLGYRDFLNDGEIRAFIVNYENLHTLEDISTFKLLNFFETSTQRSWLVRTKEKMYCVLDDVTKPEPIISWSMPNKNIVNDNGEVILNIYAYDKYKQNTGLVDFGENHRSWLYSKKLFDNPEKLKDEIQNLAKK